MREQVAQLGPEDRVVAERVVGRLELLERGHQRLRHVAATEVALHPPPPGAVGVEQAGMDRRRAERHVGAVVAGGAGPLDEEGDAERVLASDAAPATRGRSTPDATSTPTAGIARSAPATLAGSRPPARVTGTSRATAAASRSAARVPVPPGCGPPAVSRRSRSAPRGEVGAAARHEVGRRPRDGSPVRRRADGGPSRSGAATPARHSTGSFAAQLDDVGVERGDEPRRSGSPVGVGGDRDDQRPAVAGAGRPRQARERRGLVELERPGRAGHDVEPDRVGAGARPRRGRRRRR